MTRPRLAFLDASHGGSSMSQNFGRELGVNFVEFDVTDGRLPDHSDYDGVVISGSSSPVYWDEPWIHNLVSQIADAGKRGVPLLGVCFGHQVTTAALSSTVEDMGVSELGYNGVEWIRPGDGSDILAGIGERFTVFTSHGGQMTKLPSGVDLLAENEFNVHAFCRNRAPGTQLHPEYDTGAAEAIARQKDFLLDERTHSVADGVMLEDYVVACEAKYLFDNLITYVNRANAGLVELVA